MMLNAGHTTFRSISSSRTVYLFSKRFTHDAHKHPNISTENGGSVYHQTAPMFQKNLFHSHSLSKRHEDTLIEKELLQDLRAETEELLNASISKFVASEKFCGIARKTVELLEKQQKHHPLHLPSHLLLNGPGSVWCSTYETLFKYAFQVVYHARHKIHDNFSGYAFSGAKGTGKSTALRTCALVSGLLLPKYIFAYLFPEEILPPEQLIRDAAAHFPNVALPNDLKLSDIVAMLHANGYAVGLYLDEAHNFYPVPGYWHKLHAFVDSTSATALFLAASSSIMPALIYGDKPDVIKRRLGSGVNIHHFSLNGKKIEVTNFPLLQTRDQYRYYLKSRAPELCCDELYDKKKDEIINQLHICSGGRIGDLSRVDLNDPHPSREALARFPSPAEILHKVFSDLAAMAIHSSKSEYDPFNIPTWLIHQLLHSIRKHAPEELHPELLISDWLEDESFIKLPATESLPERYTFGIPYFFYRIRSTPSVSISFRQTD